MSRALPKLLIPSLIFGVLSCTVSLAEISPPNLADKIARPFIACIRLLSGPGFSRSRREFSENTIAIYNAKLADTQAQLKGKTLPGSEDLSTRIEALVNRLASQIGLKALIEAEPIKVIIAPSAPNEPPSADIRYGFLAINLALIEFLKTDDEFMAVLGSLILRHALKHDMLMIRDHHRIPMRWIAPKILANPHEYLFLNSLYDSWLNGKFERFDGEIRERLPILLKTSGYNPWAHINFLRRFLENYCTPPIAEQFIDAEVRKTLEDRLEKARATMNRLNYSGKQESAIDLPKLKELARKLRPH